MPMTTCEYCGHRWLRTANQVCLDCGVCPTCGEETDAPDRKCPNCLPKKGRIKSSKRHKEKGTTKQTAITSTDENLSGIDYLSQGKSLLIKMLHQEEIIVEESTTGGIRIPPREYDVGEFFSQFDEIDEETLNYIVVTIFEWLESTDPNQFNQALKIALLLLLDKQEYFLAHEDKLKIITIMIRGADFIKVKRALKSLGLKDEIIEALRQSLSLTPKAFKDIKYNTGTWGVVGTITGSLALLYYSYQLFPPHTWLGHLRIFAFLALISGSLKALHQREKKYKTIREFDSLEEARNKLLAESLKAIERKGILLLNPKS